MSDNKKYYYLKLKETFFDSEEMKILESMKNGIEYQNLYFRLCLLSLKSEGLLVFKNIIPYDLDMLSTVLRVSIDTVKTGIEIFKKIQLVSEMDNGVLFMTDIQSLIGQSSTEAERIKAYREKTKQLQCTENVQMYGNCTPELELKKEIKIDREINTADSAKPRKVVEVNPEAITIAQSLLSLHQLNVDSNFKKPESTIHSWAADIDKLNRIDGRDYEEISKVLNWCKTRGNFWAANIISGKKFREKYAVLYGQMVSKPEEKNEPFRWSPPK